MDADLWRWLGADVVKLAKRSLDNLDGLLGVVFVTDPNGTFNNFVGKRWEGGRDGGKAGGWVRVWKEGGKVGTWEGQGGKALVGRPGWEGLGDVFGGVEAVQFQTGCFAWQARRYWRP